MRYILVVLYFLAGIFTVSYVVNDFHLHNAIVMFGIVIAILGFALSCAWLVIWATKKKAPDVQD